MSGNRREKYATIRIEGVVLTPALIRMIASHDSEVPGLEPKDYYLATGERINEAISRSWQRMTALWKRFREQVDGLEEGDLGTSITRERWMLPLFQELGYGQLQGARGLILEGKSYPISHMGRQVPVHIVGCKVSLDKRTAGVAGAARFSPHSLVQTFLNTSDDHLWGIVTNGYTLRLLRDDISLTRNSYVEFDLQAMMEEGVYSDFVILWLLCHQSRFDAERPEETIIEKWSCLAQQNGTRMLDNIGGGVEDALRALGRGFLRHPANSDLRSRLKSGSLTPVNYYRQLLRLVYRFIFLFAAEDRDLLLDTDAKAEAKELYRRYYSMSRLRQLAQRVIGGHHSDLYEGLKVVMLGLGRKEGLPELALPALGGDLWSTRFIPDLQIGTIANSYLLQAIQALVFTRENGYLMTVDYKNLGPEELGSVYESLLELHPEVDPEAGYFEIAPAAGNERKTTGSYYTPASLVNSLLGSALEPVVARAWKQKDIEQALLDIKICDPACGSGHFLIAAAHRLAKHLAAARTGEEEPAPDARRKALRDVIANCIYGVDRNEMAVELCRINLWLESLVPGKPLSFLEHHIQWGNSLIGATPDMIEKGIPESAFEPIEGDIKRICSENRKLNRKARENYGQQTFFSSIGYLYGVQENIVRESAELDTLSDDSMDDVELRRAAYYDLITSEDYIKTKLLADMWCAAFVWKKNEDFPMALTDDLLQAAMDNPDIVAPWMKQEIGRLSRQYQFFHWHLAFPNVFSGSKGKGFDVVLGNPPWERIKLQETEWFAPRIPEIAKARNASERGKMIAQLKEDNPEIYYAFLEARRLAEGESHFIRNSGNYPLCGRGDVNTYSVFTELMRSLINGKGRVGCIVPSGIATDDTTKFFFQSLMDKRSLVSLYDFENRKGIFPGVHKSYKFCLLTISGEDDPQKHGAEFIFFAQDIADLADKERCFTLTAEDIALVNPNTKTCPIFRYRRDAQIAMDIYKKVPVFRREDGGDDSGWNFRFRRMVDMANDSHLFRIKTDLLAEGYELKGNTFIKGDDIYLPLYEAKMFHHYDHRFGTYEGVPEGSSSTSLPTPCLEQYKDPEFVVQPRYWVHSNDVEPYLIDAPWELIKSYFYGDYDKLLYQVKTWLCGYYLNRDKRLEDASGVEILRDLSGISRETAKAMEREYLLEESQAEALLHSRDIKEALKGIFKERKYKWLLAFRDITNTTNERTTISTIIPAVAVSNKAPLIIVRTNQLVYAILLIANLNSFVLDYVARQKIGGTSLNFFLVYQFPILEFDTYMTVFDWTKGKVLKEWLQPKVLELLHVNYETKPLADSFGWTKPPTWDEERRFQLRCEIDAAYFHLYGVKRDDVDYIMETFPIVKEKDIARYGSYRTKETILKYYDEMAKDKKTT